MSSLPRDQAKVQLDDALHPGLADDIGTTRRCADHCGEESVSHFPSNAASSDRTADRSALFSGMV